MGDLRAAVTVGGGLSVRVDLDGLELLGNPCSWRGGWEMERERERRGRVRQSNRKWMQHQSDDLSRWKVSQGQFSNSES